MDLIAPGIRQLDTRFGGWDQITAGFLVEGPQPALVETGARTSAQTVCDTLAAAKKDLDQLSALNAIPTASPSP